jgi:large subunit ribosomal protein L25
MAATLNAARRTETGKGAARSLRRDGRIPGVVYGHGEDTLSISLDAHDFGKLISGISVENTVLELKIDGAADSRALIREVQWHPYKPVILHVDLYQVHAGEKVHLEIPVRVEGNPLGVRDQGGVLQQVRHELSIECLPKDIPERITIDVSELEIGDSIHVRDIEVPGATILADGDLTLVTVVPPTLAKVEDEEEAEEGVIEPEVVGAEPEEEEEEAGS